MLRFNERYEEKLEEINKLNKELLQVSLNGTNSELTAKLGAFESEIDNLKTELKAAEKRTSEINLATAELGKKLDAAERNIANLQKENAELKQSVRSRIL